MAPIDFFLRKPTFNRIMCLELEGDEASTKFVNGADLSSDGKKLIQVVTCGTHYEIPDGVTHVGVGHNIFQYQSWIHMDFPLHSITIPESVTNIGKDAFQFCYNLRTITFLGNNLNEIGVGAFAGCSKLQSIIVPKGCKERYAALEGLQSLKEIIKEG